MTSRQRATTANRKITSQALGQKTCLKMKKLLVYIAKQEKELELQRQFLASNENFEPYTVFQRIDRTQDGFITPMEILNFLRDNSIHHVTEAECYYVVKFFDSDEDGKLNYPDFMQMVLPCDNNYLRSIATQRPNMFIDKTDFLTIDIERDMTKLILSEVEMHSKSENLKQDVECMVDFTPEAAYKSIDDWGYGFVDQNNLKSFLRNNKYLASEEDCFAIIRRMDCDADSKLKLVEFIDGIKPQEPYSKMLVRERIEKIEVLKRVKKQNKIEEAKGRRVNKKKELGPDEDAIKVQAMDKDYKEILSTSPLKHRVKMDLYGSPMKKETKEDPKPILKQSAQTPRKKSEMQSSKSASQLGSPTNQKQTLMVSQKKVSIKEVSKDYSSPNKMRASQNTMAGSQFKTPSQYNPGMSGAFFDSGADFGDLHESHGVSGQNKEEIERQIVNIFREQLEMERNLERSKIDLSLRTDFNLIDAFRVFDSDGKGWITASELKEGLTNFNIFAQPEDIGFFIKRYDKDEDGRLKYSEFCDSFLPTDQFHASLLAKKAPLSMYQINMTPDKIFYPQTKQMLVDTWNTHIQNERQAEKIRLNLQCVDGGFQPYTYFQIVDSKGDGIVDREEIKELLIKYNYYVSEKEICQLIDRYDRKRDGRINYSEFADELKPRSNIAARR